MARSRIIPPVYLVQRNQIEEVLHYQVWADREMHRHLQDAKRCVELTRMGCMTPAGARDRLARLARAMHAASTEFAKVVHSALKPAQRPQPTLTRAAVTVPHGHPCEAEHTWRQWQWQATNADAGCLAFEAADWNDQFAVADLWIRRAVHRALAVRAAGEYLVVRIDGLERAEAVTNELVGQLEFATNEFWSKFTLAQSLGMGRGVMPQLAAA